MSNLTEWERPDGPNLMLNNEKDTVAYAKSLKWKKVKPEPVVITQPIIQKDD